jgi:general secretion pathway protein D
MLMILMSGGAGRTQPMPEGTGTGTGTGTGIGTEPPAGEQPREKKQIAAEGDTIKINFPEMELENVLKNFSAITGKNFILDQMPKGQIRTIGPIGPVEIPKKQAFNLFVLIMSMNGYNVVPTSVPNVYKVVRTADAMRENIPVYPPGSRPTANEAMVTRFIPLQYVSATDIAAQLAQLTSKEGGQVIAYQPSNTLIVVDTAINIERMLKIIKILDVATAEPEMEIIKLKYTVAADIAAILGQIYQGASISATPRSATTRGQTPRRRNAPNVPIAPVAPQPGVPAASAGGAESTTKIIPLERMNALLVIADPDTMDAIKALIAKLDVDAGQTPTIHVYYVQNAQAEELASTLSGLSGGRSTTRTTRSTSSTTQPQFGGLGGMTTPPPAPTPVQARTQVAGGNIIEGMFGDEISINADEATNSLIVVATNQDYELLLQVIKQLDIPRRQVFVEAVLLEVTYNESKMAGASMHGVSSLDNGGMLLAGTNVGDVNSMSLLSSLLASSAGSLTMPSGITVGALGQPVAVPGTDGQVVLPSAGLIVRLLASDSSVNVLSTPTILTTDNEEASLEVGQKIPVPNGQSLGTYSSITISRESVGIKLKITPQINESDAIRLEIFTEISSVASISPTMGPTTSLKTAETTVIVRDSQTIVIGGLMEDRRDLSTSKIPWLGDIPVLGWLFKNSQRDKNKTNLIILITPHIVKSDADVERVKKHIRQGYENMAEESLGEGAPDWSAYFESQLQEPKETIDLRSGQPQVVPAPEWGWTPAAPGSQPPTSTPAPPAPAKPPPPAPAPAQPAPASGDTAGPGPRSATTNGAPPAGNPRR